MTPPGPPARTPLLGRIDAFRDRRPDIRVTPWYQSRSGRWETTEPGTDHPRPWANAAAMISHLEHTYPEGEPEPGRPRARQAPRGAHRPAAARTGEATRPQREGNR